MVGTFSDFQETMTLVLPDVQSRLVDLFGESTKTKDISSHGLIVELAAIHEGLTANFNNYKAEELEAALDTWVAPYPKPILVNHDLMVNPLGRVMAAKMDKEKDGTVYTRLQIAVTEPAAMARVATERYLTGSVGGKSGKAICSVCSKDWAEASSVSLPCKHVRGKTYKGVLAYLDRQDLGFKEYSFVNAPADAGSGVRAPEIDTDSDEWVRAARVFDLNMNKQEIVEFEESDNRSVLGDLRRKEATPLYLQLKGAFLTALSAEAAELGLKESSDVDIDENDDDILTLSEELSDDLALSAGVQEDTEDEAEEEVVAEDEADATDATEDAEETSDEEVAEEEESSEEEVAEDETDPEDEEDADEDAEIRDEGDAEVGREAELPEPKNVKGRPQGMEIPRRKHDPNTYGNSPMGGGSAGTQRRGVETSRKDLSRENDDTQDLQESDETELNEAMDALELRVSELTEENTRLKRALHRTLAERVVDSKISLGLHEATEREVLLEEHTTRSASSLADHLRDLSKMTFKRSFDPAAVPTIEELSNAVEDPNAKTVFVEDEGPKETDPEDIFVDALMGRRSL